MPKRRNCSVLFVECVGSFPRPSLGVLTDSFIYHGRSAAVVFSARAFVSLVSRVPMQILGTAIGPTETVSTHWNRGCLHRE